MTGSLSDIKKNGFSTVLLLLALLMIAGSLHAQDKQELPDSIAVDSTVTTGQPVVAADTLKVSAGDSANRSPEESVPDSVIFRTIPGPEVSKYKSDPDFAYANDPRYWQQDEVERETAFGRFMDKLLSSKWFWWFVYCLLGGLLLFALYKIVSGNGMYLFYKSPARKSAATGEDGTDIYDEDLDAKIREAIDQHDFRMGVRYLFLKALRALSDRELIRFHVQSTNQEYADQLKDHPLGKDFKFLAYAYEHVWYGERSLSDAQFERLMTNFQDFYKAADGV